MEPPQPKPVTAPAKRGERVRNQSQSRTGDGPRTGCIIAEPGHPQTTAVMNPLSELIVDLYGTATASRTRSAIGVAAVPQSPRGLLGRSRDRRPQTLNHFDQSSCIALHTACSVQPSNSAHLDARTRSVPPRSCPGALPYRCPHRRAKPQRIGPLMTWRPAHPAYEKFCWRNRVGTELVAGRRQLGEYHCPGDRSTRTISACAIALRSTSPGTIAGWAAATISGRRMPPSCQQPPIQAGGRPSLERGFSCPASRQERAR